MNILCEPCSFSTDNQSVFGRAGLNLGNNEMRRALPVSGWLSCVRQAINHLLFALLKGFLWCIGDKCIHGKQVQCFLAFCWYCLLLLVVGGSPPILLRLCYRFCSELLAQTLPICNELEEGLDFVLVNCWSRTYSANAVLCLQTINLLSKGFVGNQAAW